MKITAATLLFFSSIVIANAQSVGRNADGSISWRAGIDGVQIDFGPDGRMKRLYSKESHPVTFEDKRGIKTAQVFAEEKAKGNIVRFLQQNVATGRAVSELESTLAQTSAISGDGAKKVTNVEQRSATESLSQFSSSFSSGTLRGVVVLEDGYDEKEKEAWVVVGLSQKTIAASAAAGQMLEDASPTEAPAPNGGRQDGSAKDVLPSGFIRRGNKDF